MKKRNPAAVFFLPLITFGIYGIVWSVKTKNEMKRLGADIPTAWLIIIPLVNYYWYWKYAQGVEKVTNGQMSAALAFVLLILLGLIGMAIVQSEFNKVTAVATDSVAGTANPQIAPPAPAGPLPDNSFGGPASSQPTVSPTPLQPDPSAPGLPSDTAPPLPAASDPTGANSDPGQPQPPSFQ
jgi:hypothetical protein